MANDITKLHPKMPAPPPREPPRELHPAAMQAAADYSRAIDDARDLRASLDQLKVELLAEREIRRHSEHKLEQIERERDTLQRFCIEFMTHMQVISDSIKKANDKALEFASMHPPKRVIREMEAALADAAATVKPDA